MRRSYPAITLLLLAVSPALGQQIEGDLAGYAQQKPCQKPDQAPAAAPQAPAAQPLSPGYFAAPPQTGTVAAGTNSYGIDGLALHVPALTLKLPTLQLPSVFKMRTNPRMLLDPSQAPYVQNSPMAYGAPAIPLQSVKKEAPASPPSDAPLKGPEQKYTPSQKYDSALLELNQRLAERERQLASLDQEMSNLAQSVEIIARLAERASTQQSAPERKQPPAPTRWVEPEESPVQDPDGDVLRHTALESSNRNGIVSYAIGTKRSLRRLPPTRRGQEPMRAARYVSCASQQTPDTSELGCNHPAGQMDVVLSSPPETPSRNAQTSAFSAGPTIGSTSTGKSAQWFHLAAALCGGVVMGAGVMGIRRAVIGKSLPLQPILLGDHTAGYIVGRTVTRSTTVAKSE